MFQLYLDTPSVTPAFNDNVLDPRERKWKENYAKLHLCNLLRHALSLCQIRLLLGLDFPRVLAARPDLRTLLIDDVDGNAEHDGEREENPCCVRDAEFVVHGAGVERANTCEDVS